MTDPDSGDLLLVAAGDGAALDRLAARWKGPVYAIFERTRDAAAAAEATADVFDRLRATARTYEPGTRAEAFLNRQIAERILKDPAASADPIPPFTLASSAAARNAFVRAAVAALPPAERAAFLMTRIAGLSPEAASQALRTPAPELQNKVVHALALLRAAIEPAARQVPTLGPVERHFGPDPHPAPADLDHRLAVRLAGPSAGRYRIGRAAVLGIGAGAVVVVLAYFAIGREIRIAGEKTAAPKEKAEAPEAPAPPILRVENAPVTVDTAPATAEEEKQASALFPPEFLLVSDTLAALDPIFPENLSSERAGPPAPRPTEPPRPPAATPAELGDRITFLRHLSPADRARVKELDGAYRQRPEEERLVLWERWTAVRGMRPETSGGLRPLAQRFTAMTAAQRAALTAELRSLRALPPAERLPRFRGMAFARGLTGQELAAAEALLG